MLCFFKLLVCCSVARSAAIIAPNPVFTSQAPGFNVTGLSDEHAYCVNTGRDPIWNGRILFADCATALSIFKRDMAEYTSMLYAFYSSKNGFEPPPGSKPLEWKLPYTISHETCQIQFRMIRDFVFAEIPIEDTFLRPALYPSATISTWHSVIEEAEKILYCTRYGQPGWISDGVKSKVTSTAAPIGLFMWGRTSAIAKKYTAVKAVETALDKKVHLLACILQVHITTMAHIEFLPTEILDMLKARLGPMDSSSLIEASQKIRDRGIFRNRDMFPDILSMVIDVCINRRTSTTCAKMFSTALRELENGVAIELRRGLRALPSNAPPNTFILPPQIPYVRTTSMAAKHRRLLLQPFRITTNEDGLISIRDGVELARYYAMHLHIYALRRLRAIIPRDPERDQWVAAQKEATRIYYWIFDVWRWSAEIRGASGIELDDLRPEPAQDQDYLKALVESIIVGQDMVARILASEEGKRSRVGVILEELSLGEFVDSDLTRWE